VYFPRRKLRKPAVASSPVKIAVLSDIHSNAHALRAAIADIESRNADAIYCLGDVVGYGADAAECVDLVRSKVAGCVLGNHDEVVAFDRGANVIPKDAQKAAAHNRQQLSEEQIAWLQSLPLRIDQDGITFVHASPQSPGSWLRLDSFMRVKEQFNHFDGEICFVGHTHMPGVASDRLGVLSVRKGHRFMVNCGSVGQPRDEDPRLSYAIFDTDAFSAEVIRVGYDIEGAAQRIRDAGLPGSLADRLFRGR
jgi:diadenosine tetraphosphatase ApaH/serine/threonine PP2A family protein phosphatase